MMFISAAHWHCLVVAQLGVKMKLIDDNSSCILMKGAAFVCRLMVEVGLRQIFIVRNRTFSCRRISMFTFMHYVVLTSEGGGGLAALFKVF